MSVLAIATMDQGVTEQSHRAVLVMFLGVTNHLTAIQKNVPLLHMSTQHPGTSLLHMSTQHPGTSLQVTSYTRPSPALVLQMKNAGVKRPGYEANWAVLHVFTLALLCVTVHLFLF